MLLLLVGCFAVKTSGQGFKWLYSPVSVDNEIHDPLECHIRLLTTNSNNEIYAIGDHHGQHDFGDGQQGMIHYSRLLNVNSYFISKLDENKNVLWIKYFDIATNLGFTAIVLGDNGDIYISGSATVDHNESVNIVSLYLNPNPTNPDIPNAYSPTHENLPADHVYGFVIQLDAQGNYINSVIFPDISLCGMVKDHDNNFVAVCGRYYPTAPLAFQDLNRATPSNSTIISIHFGKSISTTQTPILRIAFPRLPVIARTIYTARVLIAKLLHLVIPCCSRI
ncbi:hypothetical protein [Flavobacterium sp. 3HN19-14]|uniref:hypothetical protein n=1 Tax=Flavobacterium sp. 3HN19-14 TaxID=3448133 RepID=UPI003EE36984